MLVRVRLFGQMLQHGHETIKTHTHLGVLLLEHMPLAFRLHAALTPLFREGVVVRLILATHCPHTARSVTVGTEASERRTA